MRESNSTLVYRYIAIRQTDGCTTPELKVALCMPAKQVYNAIKYLTRKRLILSTQYAGTLRRYWAP